MKKSSRKTADAVNASKRSSGSGSSSSGGLFATLRGILQRKKASTQTSSSIVSLPRLARASATAATHGSVDPAAAASSAASNSLDRHQRQSQLIAKSSTSSSMDCAVNTHKDPVAGDRHVNDNDDEGDDEQGDDEGEDNAATDAMSFENKSGKRGKNGKNRWVRQLLNPTAEKKLRDRVHKQPQRLAVSVASDATTPHQDVQTLFTVSNAANAMLVAEILRFLEIREPAAVCARVNMVFSAHVRAFYDMYCAHPRPQRYLAQKLFNPLAATATTDTIRTTMLSFLAAPERVRASACCQAIYASANAMPLIILGDEQATRFVELVTAERAETRFCATTELQLGTFSLLVLLVQPQASRNDVAVSDKLQSLEYMDVHSMIHVVRLLDTSEFECFPALSTLRLRSIRGLAAEAADSLFVQLIQVLFTDRVSRKLRILELSNMGFEDAHYRHLARLLYDARFPALQQLSLARNAFSSRFMRDWSRSFVNDRFEHLEALDISDVAMTEEDTQRFVACLEHTPRLRRLCISNNLFSNTALALLRDRIASGMLHSLVEFECSAITADANAMASLLSAFPSNPDACHRVKALDLSGNSVANPHAASQLAQSFTKQCWPALQHLNLSNVRIGASGFEVLANAIRAAPASMSLAHLDLGGNAVQRAVHSFSRCLLGGALRMLQFLSLADNGMGALEFELVAHALTSGSSPHLQTLDLSMNAAGSEGTTRFCAFLRSNSARSLYSLNLSQNEIPFRGLELIAETLQTLPRNCVQLQCLDVSRNLELRSVVKYQEMIRSGACPSLVSLQLSYVQTFGDGRAFVKDVLARMSVDELRRRKQASFEQRLAALEQHNFTKAQRDHARCQRQCRLLREQYDHLESEADRALRRRKVMRKSPHLRIHQEIERLKHEQYRRDLCRTLAATSS